MKFNTELDLREFRDDDVEPIVCLFNTTFRDYAGFVPRTSEYWIWSSYKRPDVAVDGIRVMTLGKKVVGYVVVGRSGNIWDICYNSQLPEAETIVYQLVSWAIDYVKKVGSDYIQLNFPIENRTVRKVCDSLNFSMSPPEYMFVSVLDFQYLVSEVLQNSEGIANLNCQAAFRVRNLPSPGRSEFGLSIKNGKLANLDESADPEITIEVDARTLISFIFQGESILKTLMTSKVKFYPYWKSRKAIQLLALLKNKSRWFMPRADIG